MEGPDCVRQFLFEHYLVDGAYCDYWRPVVVIFPPPFVFGEDRSGLNDPRGCSQLCSAIPSRCSWQDQRKLAETETTLQNKHSS